MKESKLLVQYKGRECAFDSFRYQLLIILYITLHRDIGLKSEKDSGTLTFRMRAMKVDFI